jgi:hypothetical protein
VFQSEREREREREREGGLGMFAVALWGFFSLFYRGTDSKAVVMTVNLC